MSISPQEVYYTQDLLTRIFAEPLAQEMQESAESYVKTGKFKPLVSLTQQALDALWSRAMYAGIKDAEEDIGSSPSINLSSNLSLIEFAKDPQLQRIDGEIAELKKYLREAQGKFNARDVIEIQKQIDIKTAERDLVKNPNNPKIARKVAEKLRLEKELDSAKKKGDFGKVSEIRNRLETSLVAANLNKKVKSQSSALETDSTSTNSPQPKRRVTTEAEIERARNTIKQGNLKKLLSFDPQDTNNKTKDPWGDLLQGKSAKSQAEERLLAMRNLQIYATLNEKYPSLARNSIFYQDYLKYRHSTVATSLQKQSEDRIKEIVASYVKEGRDGKTSTTLDRIRQTYKDDKTKNWYRPLIGDLEAKYEDSKFSKKEYQRYLKSELKKLGLEEKPTRNKAALEKREQELAEIENPTPAQEREMEEIERLLDEAASTKVDSTKKRSRFQRLLNNLEDEEREDKKYINPNARIKLSRLEKERIIRLGRYDDTNLYAKEQANNIRKKDSFSYKEIRRFATDLRREGGRFDDKLYKIAERTAATEVAAAYGIGRLQTYIEKGVSYVQWIATMDTRTSVFCKSLHRRIFSIKDLISASMAKQSFPKTRLPEYHPENQAIKSSLGINIWNTPAHPYCRSFLSPIYTDKPTLGGLPTKGLPPDADLNRYLLADLIERKKIFEGLNKKQREQYLQEIVESQNKMRQSKLNKVLNSLSNLQSIFNSGLDFLTRRLKQDKVANFTVEEIKRNDSRLAAALIGGAAVLGMGSMMYFFMKSNLAKALTDYLKVSTATGLAGLSKEAVTRLLKNIVESANATKSMPDSVKDLVVDSDKLDLDLTLGEKVEAVILNGELALNLASVGQLNNIDQLISGGITGVGKKARINTITRAAINSAIATRKQLNDSALSILNQAFVNKAGAIDPRAITSIQEFANVYRIGIANQKGTFVSKRRFDQVMSSAEVQEELLRLQAEIDRIEGGLDGIETIVDPADEIGNALLQKERAEQRATKAIIDSIRTKIASPEYITRQKTATETSKIRTPEITKVLERVIEEEANYGKVLEDIFNEFQSVLPSKTLIQGFIPENINSVQELKEIQKIIRKSLSEIKSDFLNSNKSPYSPAAAARKRNLTDDYLDAALKTENQVKRLNNLGFSYDSSVPALDSSYKQRIQAELQIILDLDTRISNRIVSIE